MSEDLKQLEQKIDENTRQIILLKVAIRILSLVTKVDKNETIKQSLRETILQSHNCEGIAQELGISDPSDLQKLENLVKDSQQHSWKDLESLLFSA